MIPASLIPHIFDTNSEMAFLFDQVIDIMPIGVWIIDDSQHIIYANAEGERIWGGKRLVASDHFDQYQAWSVPGNQPISNDQWAANRAIKNGEKTLNEELKIKTFDGKYKIIINSAIPIFNTEGKVIKCIVFNQDITSLRLSELQLEDIVKQLSRKVQEADMFKAAVEQAAEHIVITDADGIILYANSSVEIVTGYSQQEVLGTKAGKLWSKPMSASFYEDLWKTIKTKKEIFRGEIENRRKNGQIYTAQVTISPVLSKNDSVEYFLALERDVSHEKAIDSAKSEFVSFASHQLRTPLTAINWFTEMLLNGDAGPVNDQQRKFLAEIADGSHRMVQLVTALLNVSRIELGTFSVDPEPAQVTDILDLVIQDCQPLLQEKKVTVHKALQPVPIVNLDKKLFEIVLQNLLTNAIKYSHPDGEVVVRIGTVTASEKIDDKNIPVDALFVQVIDKGIGIPESQQDKIFSKLYRADNAIEHDTNGTGLGLYITRSIITHANGQIWYSSKENQGTTVTCWVPLSGMTARAGAKSLENI